MLHYKEAIMEHTNHVVANIPFWLIGLQSQCTYIIINDEFDLISVC